MKIANECKGRWPVFFSKKKFLLSSRAWRVFCHVLEQDISITSSQRLIYCHISHCAFRRKKMEKYAHLFDFDVGRYLHPLGNIWMPGIMAPPEVLDAVVSFQLRDTDILSATFPKMGWYLVSQLFRIVPLCVASLSKNIRACVNFYCKWFSFGQDKHGCLQYCIWWKTLTSFWRDKPLRKWTDWTFPSWRPNFQVVH